MLVYTIQDNSRQVLDLILNLRGIFLAKLALAVSKKDRMEGKILKKSNKAVSLVSSDGERSA